MNRLIALAAALAGLVLPGATRAYEDREIPPESIRTEADDVAWSIRRIDPSGPPRTLSSELRFRWSRGDDTGISSTAWLVTRGTLDTQNLGLIALDAAYSPTNATRPIPAPGSTRASFSLTQRLMPFADGWFANNFLGLIQPGHLDLIGQQYRFGVPTRTVLGAATAWQNATRGWQWSASSGTPASLDPIGQAGYTDLGGRASTAGLGFGSDRGAWRYATEVADYRRGGASSDPGAALERSGQALVQALRREGEDYAIQFNTLSSRDAAATAGWRTGYWVDASWRDGRVEHRAGLNDLPADQQWLGIAVPSAASGGYYRWRWRTRQALAEFQVDSQRLQGASSASQYTQLWANGRYQLDQSHALGLQSTLSRSSGARSLNLLGFREAALGDSSWRVLAGLTATSGAKTQVQAGGDATTVLGSAQVNATATLASDGDRTGSDLAFSATQDLTQRFNFAVSLRRFDALDAASAGNSVSLNLTYRLAPEWTLNGALTDSRGARVLRPIGVVSGPPPVDVFVPTTPRLRFALITLRHEWQAGSPITPLGAGPGRSAGAGRIEGTVFLDSNGNGRADPGEVPVSNVIVILDGRYTVRTDAQGRYEFPLVASGVHRLRILPDNIPLPWSVLDMNERSVEVEPRGAATSHFGAVRN